MPRSFCGVDALVEAAPTRQLPPAVQALVRALQAPNFNEFADKVS